MKRRIFGLENEYGLTCTLNGQRRLSPDNVARYLFEKVIPGARNANVFLENGARLYLDTGFHPEYATPECDDVAELVIHDKAGERIVEDLLHQAEKRLREDGISGNILLFKNNTDSAVRVAGGIRVVLEEQDIARDPVLAQPLLGLVQKVLDDALARLVVDHQLGDVIALRRRVLRVESCVQIQPSSIFQEHIRVAGAGDDFLEEIPRDVVGREAPLAVEGAGQAVLVLEAEDAALHLDLSLARPTSVCPGVGSAPRAGCAGTCAAPSCGPARPPRDRAR